MVSCRPGGLLGASELHGAEISLLPLDRSGSSEMEGAQSQRREFFDGRCEAYRKRSQLAWQFLGMRRT